MGLFSKILEKLGIKKDKQAGATATVTEKPAASAPAPKVSAPAKPAPAATSRAASTPKPAPVPVTPKVAAPTPISEVDVVSKLEGLAANNPAKLNWKVSIVDLLKLLDLESSFEARKEMAVELGCPPELMNDSAKMNTWLHKKVLQEIAENGGNVPKELLD
ncbi:MAG: DUF3597 domain-containing protein [Anaerolineae bacterium]|nr:DUF3597 domain-containing protein [Anaerolineae bacterium]MCI0610005.1 DUF3597 domain-containing protein [Anaerolineae bacterium]